MANPILSRPDAFTTRPSEPQYGQPQYGQPQYGQPQYGQPQYGQPQYGQPYGQVAPPASGSMTLDDVISKTAITLGLLVASAAVTWTILPDALMLPAMIIAALVGFVSVLVVSTRRVIPPAGVMAYSIIEGVFIGALSKMFNYLYNGIVVQAVGATFVAAAVTLAAYRFFNIRVTAKFQRMVFITTAAYAGFLLVNLVLSLFHVNILWGSNGVSGLGLVVSLFGAGLAVFNLITDFDLVERGIRGNAPANESWRAAFGLTVTMVWLYVEILRILSFFNRR